MAALPIGTAQAVVGQIANPPSPTPSPIQGKSMMTAIYMSSHDEESLEAPSTYLPLASSKKEKREKRKEKREKRKEKREKRKEKREKRKEKREKRKEKREKRKEKREKGKAVSQHILPFAISVPVFSLSTNIKKKPKGKIPLSLEQLQIIIVTCLYQLTIVVKL